MLQDKQVPNLILLDLMLPYLSGVEFLTIVRGRPEFDQIPVVVCTALTETNEIKGKMGNHIQSYVVKPINWAKLSEKILDALRPITIRVDYQLTHHKDSRHGAWSTASLAGVGKRSEPTCS